MSTCSSHTHRHRCLHTSTQVHTPRTEWRKKEGNDGERAGGEEAREGGDREGRQTDLLLIQRLWDVEILG